MLFVYFPSAEIKGTTKDPVLSGAKDQTQSFLHIWKAFLPTELHSTYRPMTMTKELENDYFQWLKNTKIIVGLAFTNRMKIIYF